MTDPRFAHVGHPATRLMEECAELIKAVAKAERFGYDSWHPNHPEVTNMDNIQAEFSDVMECMNRLARYIDNMRERVVKR